MVRLDELKSFIRVIELESYSNAAGELGLTQGTISNHIFALERYFNARLLTRSPRGIKPTEQGKLVYENAKTILSSIDRLKRIIESSKHGFKTQITIAASTIPGEFVLPEYIRQFREKYLDVTFTIDVMDSVKAWNVLKAGAVDFAAVGTMQVADSQTYDNIKIAEERFVLAVPPCYELAHKNKVGADEILKYPYITREASSGTRIEAEKWLRSLGVSADKLNVVLEAGSTEAVASLVSKGVGISVMSSIAAKRAESAGLVKIFNLVGDPFIRSFHLVAKKDTISGPAKVFWNFIKAKQNATNTA